jgi:hypothetical protein
MGTPKGNPKGFRLRDSGGTFADSGAGVVATAGCDASADQVRVWGRWTDTGVPGLGAVIGDGFTVVRDNVGIWTVTFTQGFQTLQSASATAMPSTTGAGTDDCGQVSTFTAGAAGACTLRILNFTGAGAADLALNDWMCFDCVLTSRTLD